MRNQAVKKRIYEIIEASRQDDYVSRCYDIMIGVAIVVGLIPLTLRGGNLYTTIIEIATSALFIMDYILRIYTSDYKMGFFGVRAYIANIFSPMSMIDLLSILPVLCLVFPASPYIRLLKLFRVARIFKLIRYSKTMTQIANVLRRVRTQLGAVAILAVIYIFISAALLFQLEPESFDSFMDAIYWSTISLTTVGYGDYAPVTTVGKIIASVSALVGVAVIALPSGIITAAYMREITKKKGKNEL